MTPRALSLLALGLLLSVALWDFAAMADYAGFVWALVGALGVGLVAGALAGYGEYWRID